MNLEFKKCTLNNVELLTEISWQTFYNAYKDNNDPNNFKKFLDDTFNIEKITAELKDVNCSFYFAYKNKQLVGYFKLNENETQTEVFEQYTIELERIYVLSEFQGKGIGKQMLYKTVSIAKEKSVDFIWLGVWKINKKAIVFYKGQGFKIFGSHIYRVGEEDQEDWLMRKYLH